MFVNVDNKNVFPHVSVGVSTVSCIFYVYSVITPSKIQENGKSSTLCCVLLLFKKGFYIDIVCSRYWLYTQELVYADEQFIGF